MKYQIHQESSVGKWVSSHTYDCDPSEIEDYRQSLPTDNGSWAATLLTNGKQKTSDKYSTFINNHPKLIGSMLGVAGSSYVYAGIYLVLNHLGII